MILDGDVAQTLGALLKEELGRRVRGAGDRRHLALGLRLHRSRPRPHAVVHGAGDDQVAGLQRGSADSCIAPSSSPRQHSTPSPPPTATPADSHSLKFEWKWVVIGACVAFTVYIAVVPLGVSAVAELPHAADGRQRRRSSRSATTPRRTARSETLAAVLGLDQVRLRRVALRVRASAPRSRG